MRRSWHCSLKACGQPKRNDFETIPPDDASFIDGTSMLDLAALMVFPALMAYAAASDLLTMTIPNKVSLALVLCFAVFAAGSGLPWQVVAMHAAAGALVLTVSFAMFACGWIGGGDAKLAAATALWLGFNTLMEYLLISTLAGGLLTLAILCLRGWPLPLFALRWEWLSRLHDKRSGVPYGIALAGAALVVYPHSPIWGGVLGS
jgi:prepilin peptidase CpaA